MNEAANLEAYSLRVYGRVQRVGFRRHILDSAQDLGLAGYTRNLPDGSVEIFVQGEGARLSKFLETVRKPPLPAIIREVEEKEATVNPETMEFKIIYGDLAEELQEGFGAMQTTFVDYWKEFRDYREEFRDYREEFKDFRGEFRDYRQEFGAFASRTDENFKLISDKYGEISEKLTVILETLIRESRETREMLNETMKSLKEALERLSK